MSFADWLLAGLLLTPPLPYLVLNLSYRRILTQKISEMEARLTAETKQAYATAYGDPSMRKTLERFFHWRTYVAPLMLSSLIASVFTALGMARAGVPLRWIPELLYAPMAQTPVAVIAGVAGAYLYGLDDLVRRHATADLSSNAMHTTWIRMAMIAGVAGVIHSTGIEPAVSVLIAFALGTIPLAAVWGWIRERANLKVDVGKHWESDLHLVQGLTQSARDRLMAEDIDSVQRLAYADPVRLLLRTNIEWNVILDSVDQALLINYIGADVAKLRKLGVRGAIEIAELTSRSLGDNTAEEVAHAAVMLKRIGEALGEDDTVAYNLSYQLKHDPLCDFVWTNYDSVYKVDEDDDDEPPPALFSWMRSRRPVPGGSEVPLASARKPTDPPPA